MRYLALLLDVYGTLVHEDDAEIAAILRTISDASSPHATPAEISRAWQWTEACAAAHGATFLPQREVERRCIGRLIAQYAPGKLHVDDLTGPLFAQWSAPAVFPDGDEFVRDILPQLNVPVCLVSNIDRADLDSALAHAGWRGCFEHIITSEAYRSYKPRPEMFHAALERVGCSAAEVLHVGDSLMSDICGAQALGIDCCWVNRKGRAHPSGQRPPAATVPDLRHLAAWLSREALNPDIE